MGMDARIVVTAGTVGVNVVFVFVDEVAWWRLPCDRRKSSISERKLAISV